MASASDEMPLAMPEDKQLKKTMQLSSSESEESLLRELCTVNGINYEKLAMGAGNKVKNLEIFFFSCPRIVGMRHFPHLNVLCIVNQRFSEISGLEECKQLQELWICETQIQAIRGLSQCIRLVKLFLYSNHISSINGLDTLINLEVLWLNNNAITAVKGLDKLCCLRDLNLAGNKISTLGTSLATLTLIEALNLSGNNLTSLKDLVGLASLPNLHSLALCDPMFSANPVCQLCNYSTYVLYHMPHLQWLDGKEVDSQELHKLVNTLVTKKKQFYRMKIHHIQMQSATMCQSLKSKLSSLQESTHSKMRACHHQLKMLLDSHLESSQVKSKELKQRLTILTQHLHQLESHCSDVCAMVNSNTDKLCERWLCELESGGNVKFTSGDPSLPWFKSCSELTNSRFSVAEVQSLGISGIELTGVVRVENRLLYTKFKKKLKEVLQCEPYTTSSHKYLLDYLFLVWTPDVSVNVASSDGFADGEVVHLTNSVNLADRPRLFNAGFIQCPHSEKLLCQVLHGQLLLCKVFVGQTAEAKDSVKPTRESFPSVDSVYQSQSLAPSSHGESHQRSWFIFNSDLVLPEYIIDYQYISPLVPEDPLDHMMSCDLPHLFCKDTDDLLTLPSSHPRLAMLDEATVLKLTKQNSLAHIKVLDLHDNRLTRFRVASSLPQLTKLVLSFNELTSAEDFHSLNNLEFLDVSFNKLASLEGMKSLPRLVHLDVSWNELSNYHREVNIIHKCTPHLLTLDATHNPWTKPALFHCYVLAHIKTLNHFNGFTITQDEASQALREVVSSHISMATLLSHSHTNPEPLPTLSLSPIAESAPLSKHKPAQMDNNEWGSKVTSVHVSHLRVRRLSCFDQLPNLQWLSLKDNVLVNIDGLLMCSLLEELTLDDNLITTIAGIGRLSQLKWLSVANNRLTSLPCNELQALKNLEYLNISNNSVSSLQGMKHLTCLSELYASCNSVTNSRELFQLKGLQHLVVVDLTNNPLCTALTYRVFTIYHLSSLRALDGQPIEPTELSAAKEKLGGRLTQDLLFEKQPDADFNSLVVYDLPHCGLKCVELSPVEVFDNLMSLNLEHNSLTSFSGLVYLNRLKVLCLNHNRVECLLHARDSQPPLSQVLHNLEVLHLAYNGISNMSALHLGRIPSLRALFLQGNEIAHVDGLEGLEHLVELVLDRNKIKSLQQGSFLSQRNLAELHIEENRMKELSYFTPLQSLERLYLGMNRIQEFNELEKLGCLHRIIELSVVSNPVSRRLQHRSLLIYHLPSLLSLDGVMVANEERRTAELAFCATDDQELDTAADLPLPVGLANSSTPLRVMNIPFGAVGHTHNQPNYVHRQPNLTDDNLLGYLDSKRRGRK